MDKVEKHIRATFNQWYKNEVEDKALKNISTSMTGLTNDTGQLAQITRNLADRQQEVLLELSLQFIAQALQHLETEGQISNIARVARMPGQAITLVINEDNQLDENARLKLEGLLDEQVGTIPAGATPHQIIAQAVGIKLNQVKIKDQESSALLPANGSDTAARVHIALASQLTGLHIKTA